MSTASKPEHRSPSPLKRFGQNALVVVASFILALIGCEILVRVVFSAEVDTARLREVEQTSAIDAISMPSDHPELLYQLRPELHVRWNGVTVASDAEGFCRIDPAVAPKTDAPLRLAVIGDSTSFGWRVEYADSYPAVLTDMLEKESGQQVWLRNFSMPGYNSQHNHVTLRDRVLPWKPDLVILHYDFNDVLPIVEFPPNYLPPEYGDNPLHSSLYKLIKRRLRAQQNRRTTQSSSGQGEDVLDYGIITSGPGYEQNLETMKQMADLLRQADILSVLFVFNTQVRRDATSDPFYDKVHTPLVNDFRTLDVSLLVDYGPHARKVMELKGWDELRPIWIGEHDGHPNPSGHQLIATLLLHDMKKNAAIRERLHLPVKASAAE